jgi:hypothetical protein
MKKVTRNLAVPKRCIFFLAGILLVITTVTYGQGTAGSEEVTIKNTARQIKPGIYECVIYIEGSEGLLNTIDDVRYTLPSGYPKRKQTRKIGDRRYPFSSAPIVTAEEVVVNIKIDYKGRKNAYLSYKLRLFTNLPQ